ncbi:MAG: hypothetical protein WC383_12415 [Gammaproteobacteria bacterium]
MPLKEEFMVPSGPNPMRELQSVLANYDHKFDEPDTVRFIAEVREKGIIGDDEWQKVLRWLDDAMACLKKEMPQDKHCALMIDADPRNADWIQIVRARRFAGYLIPHWASLWLWWIGHDREEGTYWKPVGTVAKAMRFPRFQEARR